MYGGCRLRGRCLLFHGGGCIFGCGEQVAEPPPRLRPGVGCGGCPRAFFVEPFIGGFYFGGELGNAMTQARARLLLRFGFNMPYSFMPNRIDSSDGNDVQWRPTDASPGWHLFAYGGGAVRFVGYDITLDGNTYRGGSSVVPKWLVGEALAGISARYKFFQADLNWTLRSAEFNTQKHPVHMFWTLSLKGYF